VIQQLKTLAGVDDGDDNEDDGKVEQDLIYKSYCGKKKV